MEVLLGFSRKAAVYHSCQSKWPYFVLSFVNLIYDSAVFRSMSFIVPVCRQPVLADCRITAFHFRIIGFGTAYLHCYPYTGAAMLVSGLMLMMPTMLLSGMIFPIESMPAILQGISTVIPARWYIQAVRKLMIEGVDISLVLTEIGILTVMAVIPDSR